MNILSMTELSHKLTAVQRGYINDLWHISKVESHKTYDRQQYVHKWFLRQYPDFWMEHQSGLYKLIEQETYWLKL